MRHSAVNLLKELNTVDEHSRIEAKRTEKVSDSVLESVCAFANEPGLGGGYLLLGIEQDPVVGGIAEYRAVGVRDPDKVQRDLATRCANDFNVPVRPEIWVETVDGALVVGAFVPEVAPSMKPIYTKSLGLPGGARRRIGSSDQRCSEDDLLVLYQDRQSQSYDETALLDADLSALDPSVVAEYRRARSRVLATAEELEWEDVDLLQALGAVTRAAGELKPTVAGVLLFGTGVALRRHFPMMRVDYIRVPGREWVQDPENRFDSIDMRGPLLRLIPRAAAAILDDMPTSFALAPGDLERREIPVIPDRVIREAVVNALMHRNYRLQSPVQIIRYANRLEIRNPGHSLVADDRLGEPGSLTRNSRVAAALHETGLAETKGSGIRVMRQMMEGASLSPPTFESDREQDSFVATFLFHHFLSEADLQWLRALGIPNLADDEAKALVYVREVGGVNNGIYRFLTGLDTLAASGRLRRLRDLGFLQQRGLGAGTYYVPTERLLAAQAETQGSRPETQGVGGKTQGLLTDGTQGFVSEGQQAVLLLLPPGLADAVAALGRHAPEPQMRSIIRSLCTWSPLSPNELEQLLGRKRTWLTRTYLGPMVRDGELERTIPDQPAHPNQRYRTSASEADRQPTR